MTTQEWIEIIAAANSLPNVQNAQVWDSGSGILGVLVTLKDNSEILFGNPDGNWSYDALDADNEYVVNVPYDATKSSLAEWAADVIGS